MGGKEIDTFEELEENMYDRIMMIMGVNSMGLGNVGHMKDLGLMLSEVRQLESFYKDN